MKVSFSNDIGSPVYFDHAGFTYYGKVISIDGASRRVELLAHIIGNGNYPVTGTPFLDVPYCDLRSHASPIVAAFNRTPYVGGQPAPSERLIWSYRYWRNALTCSAGKALENARQDVAIGKTRYPSSAAKCGYGTSGKAFAAYGEKHMRWIESPRAAGLRFVGYADKIAGFRHNGYYLDLEGRETVRGVVFQMAGRGGKPQFVAGYEDTFNGSADSDGPVCLSFSDVTEGDSNDEYSAWDNNPCDHDGAKTAARLADGIAELMADEAREHDAASIAGSQYGDLGEEIQSSRDTIRELLAERKQWRGYEDQSRYPAFCGMLRRTISNALSEIRHARVKREKLINGDYVAEWCPGWNTRDRALRGTFAESAGIPSF